MNVERHTFCPNCGADIRKDQPVSIGDFAMAGDGYPLLYRGQPVHLTRCEASIVWSILKAHPAHVRGSTLLMRCDSEGEPNMVRVLVRRIRIRLMRAGIPDPIETVWGRSAYRWRS